MKDYNYYIPGYTGFCPDLANHFGESYGKATYHILRERPRDLLKERLADVRYGKGQRGKYYTKHQGSHDHNKRDNSYKSQHGSCCEDCQESCERHCYEKDSNMECDRNKCLKCGYICPTYVYIKGYVAGGKQNSSENGYNAQDRQVTRHIHYPNYAKNGCSENMESSYERACDCEKYHQSNNRQWCQKVPYRQCGVIPNYTGYIPGMLFVFGESYGPSADKLLKRHQENVRGYSRCC